jgi:hypothetical protein
VKDWKFGDRAHDSTSADSWISFLRTKIGLAAGAHVAAMMKRKFRNFSFWTNHLNPTNYTHDSIKGSNCVYIGRGKFALAIDSVLELFVDFLFNGVYSCLPFLCLRRGGVSSLALLMFWGQVRDVVLLVYG